MHQALTCTQKTSLLLQAFAQAQHIPVHYAQKASNCVFDNLLYSAQICKSSDLAQPTVTFHAKLFLS